MAIYTTAPTNLRGHQITSHPGPQERAFLSKADILIYGGQAGGGKSFYLTAEPLKHTPFPAFRGLIFRRTYPELMGAGGLWEEANRLYRTQRAKLTEGSPMVATFPSGSKIAFSHLQHEKDKYTFMGSQLAYLGFDELTHFTETQFFYLLSRLRTTCGIKPYVRATCNPDATSWVARLVDWWIGDDGLAIEERSGVLRYFSRRGDEIIQRATAEEVAEECGIDVANVQSLTFIPAKLSDNPTIAKDYRGKLEALPRIERERLLGGNWRVAEGAIIDRDWIRRYSATEAYVEFGVGNVRAQIPQSRLRRYATIDTAGTSREKEIERRGEKSSWSVISIWDRPMDERINVGGTQVTVRNHLFLRHVWRAKVDWNQLRLTVPHVLEDWNVTTAYIENAHFGQPLYSECKNRLHVELVGPVLPGMDDTSRGAKLERAVASGLLSRLESGRVFIPMDATWIQDWITEICGWTGLPDEPADQIDTASYACWVSREKPGGWGGVIPSKGLQFGKGNGHGAGTRTAT